jgi:FkbM family methyltransferase
VIPRPWPDGQPCRRFRTCRRTNGREQALLALPAATIYVQVPSRRMRYSGVIVTSGVSRRLSVWRDQVRMYWRESRRPRHFVSLMRVRLSQSKVGRWVTPEPIVVDVDLVTLGPSVRLRSHTTDISVLAEITDGHTLGRLPTSVRPRTVIDLGANIGLAYRRLRSQFPEARFVCVEPDPGNLEVLRANVGGGDGQCRVIGACVGGRARRVKLATSDGEWGFRLADVDDPTEGDTDVVTMDQILLDADFDRVDVLKCDIEGAEAELFESCSSWINRVDNIIVECHTDVTSTETLAASLARNGADFEVLHVERNPAFGYELATLRRTAA